MELLVSVAIFSVIMLIATGIFQNIAKGQQATIAAQNTQEGLRYVFEVMSKEMRFAKTSNNSLGLAECKLGSVPINRVFNQGVNSSGLFAFDSSYLYFKNKNNECVYYFKRGNALMVYRTGSSAPFPYLATTTPKDVVVSDFGFYIYDRNIDPLAVKKQPYVTFFIKAYAKGHEETSNATVLETTVSSRMYE